MYRDKTRMFQWLLLSLLAYGIASTMGMMHDWGDSGLFPRAQTVLWKVGHLNLAAYIGYWVDRNAFDDRIQPHTHHMKHIRRAIIIGACVIAFSLAL